MSASFVIGPNLAWSLLSLTIIFAAATPAKTSGGNDASEIRQPTDSEPRVASVTLDDALEWLMAGSHEQAIEAFKDLAEEDINKTQAEIGLARCYMRQGRYDEALAGLTKSAVLDVAEWHYAVARLLLLKGDYPKTLKHARSALAIDQNHTGARLLLGKTLELLGRDKEAMEVYRWFDRQVVERPELPRDAEWITNVALGFLRYSELTAVDVPRRTEHVLHEMLQTAYSRVDRTYWPARIAAADLLRAKFNNDEEHGSVSDYRAALRINKGLPEAHVGLGEIALENWNFEEVESRVELARKVNPNHPPAIHLHAKSLIRLRRYEQAARLCDEALEMNSNDVIALSLRAGAFACLYDASGVEDMKARVRKINPRNSTIHRVVANALTGIRQYASAEAEFLKAVELSPTSAHPLTELGMMYMQWGFEDKARDVLDAAWVLDPFNKRTKFTLELLDSLHRFARVESEHFVVRYDADRDPTLGKQVSAYLEDTYPRISADFGVSLDFKTTVELFPTQRAFAVRITGNPWIHTIGACTGRVIAMASPRHSTDLMGVYDFARVLTHEFTHTVTLEATQNRIPHWFTEGLAVAQEDAPRSFEWMELLAEATRHDRLFTLDSIDWAFVRPKRRTDRTAAYAQSEWMCEYIVERFGYDVINAMLRGFREGMTQPEVFREELGLDPEEFTRDFFAWAKERVARWGFDLTPPEDVEKLRASASDDANDAGAVGRLARAEYDAGDLDRALADARRALDLDENEPVALKIVAKIMAGHLQNAPSDEVRLAYESETTPILERLLKVDDSDWTALRVLGELSLHRKEWGRATEMFKRLQSACPADPASWRGLAGIYLSAGDLDSALPQLLELARGDAQSPDVAENIAGIYRGRGRLRDAQYWFRRALHIDPLNVSIHRALADTYMQAGDAQAALGEYAILTEIEPHTASHFEFAAAAAHKLGDSIKVEQYARRAVELDPESAARSLLP